MGDATSKDNSDVVDETVKEPKAKPEWGGLTHHEVMNAAKADALVDDWTCIKAPPVNRLGLPSNERLPGLRYGASIEMRPLTMLNPCPCAGGVWTPPHADDGAELDASGLWHLPRDQYPRSAINGLPTPDLTILSHPPAYAPDFVPLSKKKENRASLDHRAQALSPQLRPTSDLAVSSTATGASADTRGGRSAGEGSGPTSGLPRWKRSRDSFMDMATAADMAPDKYFPGSEPYSIDYGCAKGFERAGPTNMFTARPGLRWKDTASWTALAVATPCPCALGTFSALKPPEARRVPQPPDGVFITPGLGALSQNAPAPWQGGSHTMLGSMGATSAVLALASTVILSAPRPLEVWQAPPSSGAFL